METSSSDDSDPFAVTPVRIFVLAFIFIVACHDPVFRFTRQKAAATPAVTASKTEHATRRKSKKKKLYLTFDDGPNRGTRNVLQIVEDEKVPASFFIVGQHVFASKYQQQTWDSLQAADNIDLCNHSFCHANNHYKKYYEDADSVVRDFKKTQDTLQFNNSIVRTPGRNIWRVDSVRFTDLKKSTAAGDSLQKAGFIVMGWDLEWHFDPKTMNVTNTADDLISQIDSAFAHHHTRQADNLVLLAHDQVYQKPDDSIQLRQFIQHLKLKDEYELSLVTTYPGTAKRSRIDTLKVKGTQ